MSQVPFDIYMRWLLLVIFGTFLVFQLFGYALLHYAVGPSIPHRKIVPLVVTPEQNRTDFRQSLISQFIFVICGLMMWWLYNQGYSRIYEGLNDLGLTYYVVSFFILHVLHDTYFYWTHRAFHEVSWLKRLHVAHHTSRAPTALSATSFSWGEALVQGLFYVLVITFVPLHWSMVIFFYVAVAWISMIGHCGFEFWPNSLYRFPYGFTFNSLSAHNLHHFYGRGNYSLYYRFWDEVCDTNHPETYNFFYKKQKEIKEALGSTVSLERPHPNDSLGIFFEECQAQGDDVSINIKTWPTQDRETTYSHSNIDPLSALKDWHDRNGFDFKVGEKTKVPDEPFVVQTMHFITAAWTFLYLFFRGPKLSALSEGEAKVQVLNLSKAETESAKKRAEGLGLSLPEFLLWNWISLSTSSSRFWQIEVVGLNKKIWLEKGRKKFNQSTLSVIDVGSTPSVELFHRKFSESSQLGTLTFWSLLIRIWDLALKFPFKFGVWLIRKRVRYDGYFCDLGIIHSTSADFAMPSLPTNTSARTTLCTALMNDQLVLCYQCPSPLPLKDVLTSLADSYAIDLK